MDLAKASKIGASWTAIAAALSVITLMFVTGSKFTEYQIDQSLKRIDDYEKTRYYYNDLEREAAAEGGTLSGPDARRAEIIETVLEREYRDLEGYRKRLETLEAVSPL